VPQGDRAGHLESIAIPTDFRHNRFMSKACCRRLMVVLTIAFLACGTRAMANDGYYGQPLIQASFDKLIPTSYPTATARFDRVHSTTWPLIDPGVANIPITANLIHPTDYPLLIPTEGVGPLRRVKTIQRTIPVVNVALAAHVSRANGKSQVATGSELRRIPATPQY